VTTRSEILEWLKNNMSLIYHATSSCKWSICPSKRCRSSTHFCTGKMGASNDTTAVVDSRARVRGVTGLRVVDASAFPFVPPGFPMATVCMYFQFTRPNSEDIVTNETDARHVRGEDCRVYPRRSMI
jgi:choline dehydrogenase